MSASGACLTSHSVFMCLLYFCMFYPLFFCQFCHPLGIYRLPQDMCRHSHVVMSSVEWLLENSWLGVWAMVGPPVPGTSLGRDSQVLGVSGWSILVHQVVSWPISLIPGSPIVEIAPAHMIQNLGLSKGPEALLWPAWGSGWQPPTAPILWLEAPAGSYPVATAHGWTEPTHSPSRAPGSLGFFSQHNPPQETRL